MFVLLHTNTVTSPVCRRDAQFNLLNSDTQALFWEFLIFCCHGYIWKNDFIPSCAQWS